MSYSSLTQRNTFEGFLGWDARLRSFRDPFRLKMGSGRILGLENTSEGSAYETTSART